MGLSFFKVSGRALRLLAGRIRSFVVDRAAVSTVEYALIVVAVIAIVGGAGVMLSGSFETLFTELGTDLTAEADALGELNPGGTSTGGSSGSGDPS